MNQFTRIGAVSLLGIISLDAAADDALAARLSAAAPTADPKVIQLALDARQCAIEQGLPSSRHLGVIDYSLPSAQPRLWVFDLAAGTLEFLEWVAHGRNSGNSTAHAFSNRAGSLASSLGLFRTLDAYTGHDGYALRLDGLDFGFNDRALDRAIVMHGAWYVSPDLAQSSGRIGLSWGCPAVRPAAAHPIIDALKGGQYLFAYYPEPGWLKSSPFLHCHSVATTEPSPKLASVAP
jgi:hypothetical protein